MSFGWLFSVRLSVDLVFKLVAPAPAGLMEGPGGASVFPGDARTLGQQKSKGFEG